MRRSASRCRRSTAWTSKAGSPRSNPSERMITTAPRRSAGMSFNKTPAYWRVDSVVPKSSADLEGVQPGDLIIRINGESVTKWDLRRYEQLVTTGEEIALTFLNGNTETEKRVKDSRN